VGRLPWDQRKNITVVPGIEREIGLTAYYQAWERKADRHPY